ncbi:MAG: hypothetical protein IPP34_22250 [Bacteroidetes bacterium]|nr:hypothetical protein [Bacteroidota bacterium]
MNKLVALLEMTATSNELSFDDFTFIGYDLLDQSHGNSALIICVRSPDVFTASELNKFGLIEIFDRALQIPGALLATNPDEFHFDTNI